MAHLISASRRSLTLSLVVTAALVAFTTPDFASSVAAANARVTLPEFDAPSGLAVTGTHLWVANSCDSTLTEVDTTTGARLVQLGYGSPVFGFSHPVAIIALGTDLFVANANDTVSEVNAIDRGPVRVIGGTTFRISHPVALATVGNTVLVLNSGPSGSITEFSASSGAFLMNIRGAAYAFDDPAALAVTGTHVFVADKGNDSVTEVDATTGKLVRVIARQGLSAPDGVAIGGGSVWVADQATSGVTAISAATGQVLGNRTDANATYGFWHPTVMASTGANIYVATPLGTSPMVTRMSSTTAKPYWFMCNTNGPYYFSLLSAFAVAGPDLWVASRSGANSKTPAAATGSLTELNLMSGALVRTVPAP